MVVNNSVTSGATLVTSAARNSRIRSSSGFSRLPESSSRITDPAAATDFSAPLRTRLLLGSSTNRLILLRLPPALKLFSINPETVWALAALSRTTSVTFCPPTEPLDGPSILTRPSARPTSFCGPLIMTRSFSLSARIVAALA